jgi:hypothetical protein
MNTNEFALNTITEPMYRCMVEAYRNCFPDLSDDIKRPYVDYRISDIDGKKHMVMMLFGNSIHMQGTEFVLRVIDEEAFFDGDLTFKEYGRYKSIKELIMVILQRQLDIRIQIFFSNELNDDGNEIPFSSRYECALRGKIHKEK